MNKKTSFSYYLYECVTSLFQTNEQTPTHDAL